MDIITNSRIIGEDFAKHLNTLIDTRIAKRRIYNDTYLTDTPAFLIMKIEDKLKRVKLHVQNNTVNNDVEKCEDNLIDLAIYSLFLCSVLEKELLK
ncbi:MAG: hypothetical protein AABY22_31560 [Nanoarchaeota archaeon]